MLVAVLVTTLGTGCSRTSPEPDSTNATASGPTAMAGIPRATVVDLCSRFTLAALGVDTTTDRGPADARGRAAERFGTPELRKQLAGEGRDQTWPVMVEHQARVLVTTEEVTDDPPPAQGNQVGAAVVATRVAVGADGWRQDLPTTVAYCSLVTDQAGMKVSGITFADSVSPQAPR